MPLDTRFLFEWQRDGILWFQRRFLAERTGILRAVTACEASGVIHGVRYCYINSPAYFERHRRSLNHHLADFRGPTGRGVERIMVSPN